MDEASLRRGHRTVGLILALFVILQAATGALLAFESAFLSPGFFGPFLRLHLGGGFLGHLYRIILGLGLVGMAISGTLIFLKVQARKRGIS